MVYNVPDRSRPANHYLANRRVVGTDRPRGLYAWQARAADFAPHVHAHRRCYIVGLLQFEIQM